MIFMKYVEIIIEYKITKMQIMLKQNILYKMQTYITV